MGEGATASVSGRVAAAKDGPPASTEQLIAYGDVLVANGASYGGNPDALLRVDENSVPGGYFGLIRHRSTAADLRYLGKDRRVCSVEFAGHGMVRRVGRVLSSDQAARDELTVASSWRFCTNADEGAYARRKGWRP